MSNELVTQSPQFSFGDMERMADAIAKSRLFGTQTKEQALALMLLAQAEGRHPALAARDYDIIQNRPAKKAEAMLRDFLGAGGKVEWHELSDTIADATFSHPSGGSARIAWDVARAQTAGLTGKDMYKKFPRQMLRSRVVSEGVRTVWPSATGGLYVPEEAALFDPVRTIDAEPVTRSIEPEKIEETEYAIVDADGVEHTHKTPETAAEALIAIFEAAPTLGVLDGLIDSNDGFVSYLETVGLSDLRGQIIDRLKPARRALRHREMAAAETVQRPEVLETPLAAEPPTPQQTPAADALPEPSREIAPKRRNGRIDWEGWIKEFGAALSAADGNAMPYLLGDNEKHIAYYKQMMGPTVASALDALIKRQWERIG